MKPSADTALLKDLARDAADDGIVKKVVGAVITESDGKVLLLRRTADDHLGGLWELPSGGVDEGETLIKALRREVEEETGLAVTAIGEYLGHFDYLSRSGKKTRQFNFSATVDGGTAIRLTEHDAHEWANADGQKRVSSAVRQVLETWRERAA